MPRQYMIVTYQNLDEAEKKTGKSRSDLLTLIETSYANTTFRRARVAIKPIPRKKKE